MTIYYSATACGFYDSKIHGDNTPADAKEISSESYGLLLAGQSDGKAISSDKDGYPILIDDPAPEFFQVARITRAQGKKQLIIAGLYDSIKTWVDDPASSELGRIGFYDEQYWLIDDEFVLLAKDKLKLTGEQLQDLFNQAAKI